MIRTIWNNHRPRSLALFALAACASLGLSASRVAADPADLEQIVKRGPFRVSRALPSLKATAIQQPIVIGPFPRFVPRNRLPQNWSSTASTPRGPRTKRRPTQEVAPDVSVGRPTR